MIPKKTSIQLRRMLLISVFTVLHCCVSIITDTDRCEDIICPAGKTCQDKVAPIDGFECI